MKANTPIPLVKPKNNDVLNDVYPAFNINEKTWHFVDKKKTGQKWRS